jgi:hypothetical protein
MKHKWGTPDMLLGRAYRFCAVCGAAQHADGAVRQFRYQNGIADYVRPRPRWVYEGSATGECPGKHTEYP